MLFVRVLKKIFLEIPLYLIALAFHRQKDIWVFGAWFGNRYSDNSRYLFEYICENHPEIRAVWLTRRKDLIEKLRAEGKEAYLINSVKGYFVCCKAGVAILTCGRDDVNRWGIQGAFIVQLWHGTPLKKVALDDRITPNANNSSFLYTRLKALWQKVFSFVQERYDLVVAPSEHVVPRLASAFGLTYNSLVVTGYPRGDRILLSEEGQASKCLRRDGKKVILYAPTHRLEGKGNPSYLFRGLDWTRLEQLLKKNNATFIIKMHYYHREHWTPNNMNSNIVWMGESECEDINSLLPMVDILITDYSSVFFDYLMLDRPIIFFPFDIHEYVREDREFYEDYYDATPGPKAKSWMEIMDVLDAMMNGEYPDGIYYRQLRQQACRKYNKFVDTNNCKRVTEAIFRRISM